MCSSKTRKLALFAGVAAVALSAAEARAQSYGYAAQTPPPLYPYVAQPGQPYAIEVAPGTYVINRPAQRPRYPYVQGSSRAETRKPAPKSDRPRKSVDHALIDELRQRSKGNTKGKTKAASDVEVVNTVKVVRDKPVVVERKRYVDLPPRVVTRYIVEGEAPAVAPPVAVIPPPRESVKPAKRGIRSAREETPPRDEKARVIRAEAEVTILGPDRMSIRLFRKGQGAGSAHAED